jgi:ligand-binding sensor domain-containing protein
VNQFPLPDSVPLPKNNKIKLPSPIIVPFSSDGVYGGFLNMKSYSQENGLVLDVVSQVFCDSRGYLWIGTVGGGVSRFDGNKFINYSTINGLPNNVINGILEDNEGRIWFATDGGLSVYDGISFRNFTKENSLRKNEVVKIFKDKFNRIWAANTDGGIFYIKGDSIKYLFNKNEYNFNAKSVILDKDSNLWIGTVNEGVIVLINGNPENKSKFFKLKGKDVRALYEDTAGNIWIGTWGEGLIKYNALGYTKFDTENGMLSNHIRQIYQDSKGNIWVATKNGGIAKIYQNKITNYTKQNGLVNNDIRAVFEDKNGSIWIGTEGGGLNRYDGDNIFNYTQKEGLPDNVVWAICKDHHGNLNLATESGGICIIDKTSFKIYSGKNFISDNVYASFCDRKGNIWFGTENLHIVKISDQDFYDFHSNHGILDNHVRYIYEDRKGNLWFGTDGGGVILFDGNFFRKIKSRNGLGANEIMPILQDRAGNMWFGSLNNGVIKYDGKHFFYFNKKNGFPDNTVWCMEEDKFGNIWFGTNGQGLIRYDGKSFLKYQLDEINDNVITQIKFTKENLMLLGTNYGLIIITSLVNKDDTSGYVGTKLTGQRTKLFPVNNKKNNLLKNFKPVTEVYNIQTGYPIKDINSGQHTIFVDDNGILWIATGSDKTGLVRFDYKNLNRNKTPLNLTINEVKIYDERVPWFSLLSEKLDTTTLLNLENYYFKKSLSEKERSYFKDKYSGIKIDKIKSFTLIPENLVLPYHLNNIGFEFSALELARPFMVRYKYKLEGFDKDWSPETDKAFINYSNLYEGNYTFKVMAKSPWGVWSKPIQYSFKILPPWYRTWWMYLVYVLSFILFMYLVIRMNIRRLKKRELFLKVKVEEATNELRLQNNIIEMQKKLVEQKNKDITDSIKYSKRIQDAILPNAAKWKMYLPDSFILYLPKDIVAGDFYWLEYRDNNIYVSAADCTGHGVSGAMVSVVCSNALSKAVLEEKIMETDEILNRVREIVIEKLTSDENIRDGMDICLIRLTKNKKTLQYSGANRSLFVISSVTEPPAGKSFHSGNEITDNGGGFEMHHYSNTAELTEFKPDKQPIGRYEEMKPFSKQEVVLQKNCMLYLTTDGYADQLGGLKGKKIGSKRFKELLIENAKIYDSANQHQHLLELFSQWKGNEEQIDDITILGIRV